MSTAHNCGAHILDLCASAGHIPIMADTQLKIISMAPSLSSSDLSEEAKKSLADMDVAMFRWLRKLTKGEMTGRLLAATDLDLEPALFQGLMAVVRITHGVAREAPQEPTVGLVAEELNIDPSRASRIASELIARGFIERAAAQDDGRKSVLLLTDKGRNAFEQVRELRWNRILRAFEGWSEQDIKVFSRLFIRYADALLEEDRWP